VELKKINIFLNLLHCLVFNRLLNGS